MSGRGKYHQGDWKPTNPQKYLWKKLPHYRSSWERRLFTYLDTNDNVLAWGSEGFAIPYYSPLDGKNHLYVPDIICKVRTPNGEKTFVLEVKPLAQSQPAKVPKRKTAKAMQTFNEGQETYIRNQAKWEACQKWCEARNITFKVVTEKELGLL